MSAAEKRRKFADLPTEELRAMARETDGRHAAWHEWTREMLLAFFHNRHGRFLPEGIA